ncbi:MAG: hypothetical protein HQK49_04605 [Oligoflexia bacterium]|nr:hypothetical protein [Oligoflexia bacterium]
MSVKRKFHLVFGLALLFLGLYGVYDEIFNVVDLIKGAIQPVTIFAGGFLLFLGMQHDGKMKNLFLGGGAATLVIGLYGLYDEWYTFIDMVMGILPLFCILAGGLSLIAGIKRLKA